MNNYPVYVTKQEVADELNRPITSESNFDSNELPLGVINTAARFAECNPGVQMEDFACMSYPVRSNEFEGISSDGLYDVHPVVAKDYEFKVESIVETVREKTYAIPGLSNVQSEVLNVVKVTCEDHEPAELELVFSDKSDEVVGESWFIEEEPAYDEWSNSTIVSGPHATIEDARSELKDIFSDNTSLYSSSFSFKKYQHTLGGEIVQESAEIMPSKRATEIVRITKFCAPDPEDVIGYAVILNPKFSQK